MYFFKLFEIPRNLSVSLIKATVPQTATPIAYNIGGDNAPCFSFSVNSASAPNVAGTELKILPSRKDATRGMNNLYSSTVANTVLFYPFDYTCGKDQLLGVINSLINGQFTGNTAPDYFVQHPRTGLLQLIVNTFREVMLILM